MRERESVLWIGSGRWFVVYDMLSLESDRDVIECVWCEWICVAILMKFESHYLYYLRLRVRHRPREGDAHSRRRCRNPYREVRLSPAVSRPQRSYRQLLTLFVGTNPVTVGSGCPSSICGRVRGSCLGGDGSRRPWPSAGCPRVTYGLLTDGSAPTPFPFGLLPREPSSCPSSYAQEAARASPPSCAKMSRGGGGGCGGGGGGGRWRRRWLWWHLRRRRRRLNAQVGHRWQLRRKARWSEEGWPCRRKRPRRAGRSRDVVPNRSVALELCPVEDAVTYRAELESAICIGFVEHVLWLHALGGGLDGGGSWCQAAYGDF